MTSPASAEAGPWGITHMVAGLSKYVNIGEAITPPPPKALSVPLASVRREEIRWLWPGWVPRGRLTLVAGEPGVGKSWFTLALAAAVTSGAPLPGELPFRPPEPVLLLSFEDDAADTIRPRIEDMLVGLGATDLQAVLGRVHVFQGVREGEDAVERGLALPADIGALEALVKETTAALVVVDPLVAALGAGIDTHKQGSVRQALAPLHALAQRTGAAVVAVAHLRKAPDQALHRVGGSIDFVAGARVAIAVGRDPSNPARRGVAVFKSNLSEAPAPLAFHLEGGGFLWEASPAADLDAERLIGLSAVPPDPEERGALAAAAQFLREALADGERAASDVRREAKAEGISDMTLRRAATMLGVHRRRVSLPGAKRGEGEWRWRLPDQGDPTPPHADDHLDQVEANADVARDSGLASRCSYDHVDREGANPTATRASGQHDQGDHPHVVESDYLERGASVLTPDEALAPGEATEP